MGHVCSIHPVSNPVCATTSLILYLQDNRATPKITLDVVRHGSKLPWIWSTEVTTGLLLTTRAVGPNLGFRPEDNISRAMHVLRQ